MTRLPNAAPALKQLAQQYTERYDRERSVG